MATLTQLKYLLAVERAGHFGSAAQSCGIAQPTLSAQIQKAEASLGIKIFDREAKPIRATAEGQNLLAHARAVLDAHERMLRSVQSQSEVLSGDFAVAIIPTLAPYLTPWFVGEFSKTYAQTTLALFERPTDTILSDLHNQRIDAALLATPLQEKGLVERPIFYDAFYLYAHSDDPLLSHTDIDAAHLDPTKVWLLQDDHCVRTQIVNFCHLKQAGHPIARVSFAAGSFETLRNLVDQNGGYTLFPETFVRSLPKHVRRDQVRPFNGTTPVREISLVYTKKTWKNQFLDAFYNTLKQNTPKALLRVGPDGDIISPRPE